MINSMPSNIKNCKDRQAHKGINHQEDLSLSFNLLFMDHLKLELIIKQNLEKNSRQ